MGRGRNTTEAQYATIIRQCQEGFRKEHPILDQYLTQGANQRRQGSIDQFLE